MYLISTAVLFFLCLKSIYLGLQVFSNDIVEATSLLQ